MSDQHSRWFPLFLVGVFLHGAFAFGLSWILAPISFTSAVLVLMVAAFVSENASLPLVGGGTTSLAYPMTTAAALLVGPVGAGLVALSCTVTVKELREKKPTIEILGNAGQLLLTGVLPSAMFLWLGGRVLIDPLRGPVPLADDFPSMLVPLLALSLGIAATNAILVTMGISLKYRRSPVSVWRSGIAWLFPYYISLAALGVAIAQVLTIHPAAFLLLVFPLVVSRQLYQNYLALKGMYRDTVRSLVAALEAKDPYTRGHSERVARYVTALARRIGLSDERVERLGLAAQLHDLGKVAIRTEVLHKPTGLSSAEYDEIRSHPEVGAAIVAGVPALGDLADIVRHHHERHDGSGYCAGLSGSEIPLESRLLAIADSYDAMTTERAYRGAIEFESAIDEIRSCAGTQFDPELVTPFIEVICDELEVSCVD